MPINYKDYHPKWKLISRLIRFKRAGNRCEECGAPNGQCVYRGFFYRADTGQKVKAYQLEDGQIFHAETGQKLGEDYLGEGLPGVRLTKRIVLTVAHLDQDKTNNRFRNLKALCQRCHLAHDGDAHARNRKFGHNHKRHQLTLFAP